MEILFILVGVVLGFGMGYLLAGSKVSAMKTRAEMLENSMSKMSEQHKNELQEQRDMLTRQMESQLMNQRETLTQQMNQQRETFTQQIEQQRETMTHQMQMVREQLNTSAESILKSRSEELSNINKEQLSQILTPLQAGIKQMQEAVEKNRMERTETMSSLRTVINQNMQQTEKLGEKTENLANALARDNKYQGNFGEVQLRKMLEDMGLERGKHFEEQVTLRDEAGNAIKGEDSDKRMQPDVILHFPDSRDIIIDAKASLTAFLRYSDTTISAEERRQAVKDHVTSVRNQVRLLASKSYWRQYNQKGMKLDFVVMFMCSENALQLALSEEPTLWDDAYKQGVLITGPQNLYALLRILELSWKQMAQVENQQNIIDCANEIVSRVQLFWDRLLTVEADFEKLHTDITKLKTSAAPTGASITTSAQKLLKYGAKEDPKKKRALPREDDAVQ